jgi:hypothetical protein
MSDQINKPTDDIPAKYKPVNTGEPYRGVIPGKHETRDPANRRRHGANEQRYDTEWNVFD